MSTAPPSTMNNTQENISFMRVVMFPWLAHGHIFPYLELAKRLILNKSNFYIHFCSTAVNFASINTFLHANSLQNSIELVELHLEPNPHLPPHYHTTKNLPSNLTLSLLKAFQTAKASFSHILTTLNPDLIIYDVFQPWAATAAASQSIPAVHFTPLGAATRSYVHHTYVRPDPNFPFPELHLHPNEKSSLDSFLEFLLLHVFDGDTRLFFVNFHLSSEVVLLKTTRSFEGKYVDYVASLSQKRILAVGPLVSRNGEEEEEVIMNSDIMRWLGNKEKHSTVYVSFGSEHFLSKEEIVEIAKGLELCEANFIWVIRFPATEVESERESAAAAVEEVLPEGFLERVGERGRVETEWVPQASILRHSSTGAFVSHCGWSSLNESVYYGVPVVGMPMKLIMFVDARMVVDAGVCVEVAGRECGSNGVVYMGEEIAKAIDEVMVGESGEGMRRRAKELSEKMRMEEEGDIHHVAHHLSQLCKQG